MSATYRVAVRALATRDLTGSNALRVLRREIMAGLLNGIAFDESKFMFTLSRVAVR